MPAMAAAAFPSTRRLIRLMPATSTTEYMTQTSLAPTYGDTSPEAMVDTSSLGKPTGSAAKTWAAIDEPPEPPADSTPCTRPWAARTATTAAAPRPISVTARPRSPAARSAARPVPAAAATVSPSTSGASPAGSPVPASTVTTSAPAARSRAARNAKSGPLVSKVPTRATAATLSSPPQRRAPEPGGAASPRPRRSWTASRGLPSFGLPSGVRDSRDVTSLVPARDNLGAAGCFSGITFSRSAPCPPPAPSWAQVRRPGGRPLPGPRPSPRGCAVGGASRVTLGRS